MKYQFALKWLLPVIFLLALFAAAAGFFWPGEGQPYSYTNHRGETVMLNGRGLYKFDTVSSVAQMQANDLITLVVGLPLLAVAAWLAFRSAPGSPWALRGQLLLTGTVGFFLYTYLSMAMTTAYNPLFLVYVILFSASLFAFIFCMLSFDLATLPQHFSERLPRRGIAILFYVTGSFLLLAWLGRIGGPLLQNQDPALENNTSLVIQVMDLGIIVPLAFLSASLLMRRSPWGYLLGSVLVLKMLTMGLAVSTMGINMALNGVPDSPVILGVFILLTLVNLGMAFQLLRSIQSPPNMPLAA